MIRRWILVSGLLAAPLASAGHPAPAQVSPIAPAPSGSPLLLADTTSHPSVTVSWPSRDGSTVLLRGERAYRSRGGRTPLGPHLEAFVALGGARLEKGFGHPRGAVVQVGISKRDARRLYFADLAENGQITVTLRGVRMNQPAAPVIETALIHFRYMDTDLAYCGIDPDFCNLYLTRDPDDPLAMVIPDRARFGLLDGAPGHGRVTAAVEPDGSISIGVSFPYELLRHPRDPYLRATPGAFLEPQYFTVEMELLPAGVPREPPRPPAAPDPDPTDTPPQTAAGST